MTPKPSCEPARLEALYRYDILDTESDSAFDDLARLASYICRTPIAVISFVDSERQWFKSAVGLAHKETPRETAFCAYTIAGADFFIVENADTDERFRDHPWVIEQPALRFYAGAPLISPDGYAIGSLAVMDVDSRTLSPEQRTCLRTITNQIMAQLELRQTPQLDNRHKPDRWKAIVTEEKKAEELIQGNEHKFRAIFEQAPIGISTIDSLTGRFKSVNTSYCKIIGYTGEEMFDRTFIDITHPDDLQADLDQMKQLLDGNISKFEMDKRLIRKNGDTIWVHLTCVPLWRQPSDPRVHLAIVQDISERKRTEEALSQLNTTLEQQVTHRTEALRSSEERLKQAVDVADLGIFEHDHLADRIEFSPRLRAMFCWDTESPICPHEIIARVFPLDQKSLGAAISRGQDPAGDGRLAHEHRVVWSDGSTHWVSVQAQTWFLGDGNARRPLRTVGAVQDITERKRAEKTLADHNVTLEKEVADRTRELLQSEQAIRALHDATAAAGLSFTERIQAVLEVGCRRFGLPIGMLTRAMGERLEFTHVRAPGTSFTAGMDAPLGNTYCNTTLQATDPVCFEHAKVSEWQNHPGYKALGLESYIGTKLIGREQVYGTICFTGQNPLPTPFSQSDKDFIQLMARWISGELDRQKAEQALKQSEERYRTLYDDTPTMYFTLAMDGTVRSVNRFGAEQLGYRVRELVGQSVLGIFYEEDKESVAANLSECLATPEITRHWEFRKVRKDGSVIWVQETARVGQSSAGETIVLVTCEDITERRRTEEAFRKSEQYSRILFENSPIGLALCRLDGTIEDCNDRYVDILGRDRSAILGKTYWELTSKEYDEQARAAMETICRTGRFGPYEKEYIHAKGHLVPVRLFGSLIEKDGELFMVCSVEDITERRQTESRLRATQHAIDHATDYIFVIGSDGYFLDVNESACRRLGYTKEELLTKSVMDIDPDFPPSVWKGFWEEFKHTKLLRLETRHRSKSGEIYPVEVVANYILHEGKELDYAFVRDISERKRAEEALQSSEERFRLVAQATQDILWDWDFAANTRWWSQNGQEKFGCDLNIMPDDKSWASRLHPDDRDGILALVKDALSSKRHMFSGEYRFRLADGSYGHFYDRAYILRDGSGKPTRAIGAMIDVTNVKQAYTSLQEAYHRLQLMANELQTVESNERRRLSRELHDEVGQLLTALKFDLESVRRERDGKKKITPTQVTERLARALETTDLLFTRLRQIVRALRPPVLEELGLKAALESLTADVQARTGLACSVVVEGNAHEPGLAPTREMAIYRIAQELLTNVIRHARAKTASISLAADPDQWILTVGDDGIGFDPTVLPLTGGVGLRGIRERAEILGGRVDVTSQQGQGTLAIVWIPIVVAPAPRTAPKPGRTPSAHRRGRKQAHD